MTTAPPRIRPVVGATLLLLIGSLALFWPGIAMYDSVGQFAQALSGAYEDWHPPIMAYVWAVLHRLFGGTAEPMLVLQMALYWAGFGLIAAALARRGGRAGAAGVLVIGALPLFLGWQAAVLKDTQMLGAMLAAVGLIAWWRLRGVRVPLWAMVGVALLLAYATLVRANAVFATVPLAVMLFGPTRWWMRGGLAVVGIGAVLALSPLINHGVLRAAPTGVEKTEALYDLSGIAARAPDDAVGFSSVDAQALVTKRCVKPFFWDPLGDQTRCGPIVATLQAQPAGSLYRLLTTAILRHPLAYAAHRLAHVNSTERWFVPAGWPNAVAPVASEPNTNGLRSPGPAARVWQVAARWMAESPLGWPVAWLVLAVVGLAVAVARASTPLRDLALALLVSAIAVELSFGGISIASDLRYHLWSMVATALATVLLWQDQRWSRRAVLFGGAALAVVMLSGGAARLTLPAPPLSYHDLLQ